MQGKLSKKIGKFLAFVLRHDPSKYGVKLDAKGFAEVSMLLDAIRNLPWGKNIELSDVLNAIRYDDKGRFELVIRDGKYYVRALYGHSKQLEVDIDYPRVQRGEIRFLYHGTQEHNIPSIFREGILPGSRKFVHLSKSLQDAVQVAKRRRGKPVVLVVDAEGMLNSGHSIFRANERVYLAHWVPPKYILKVLRNIF